MSRLLIPATLARLGSTFSGLKLQAIIHAQIGVDNCVQWGDRISKASYYDKIQSVHPIHSRLTNEPDFLLGDLYFNSVKSVVISFTSTLENYLKNSLKSRLGLNDSLLKKALAESKITIDPMDIVDFDDIGSLQEKYKREISDYVCTGELWKAKFKKYINTLALSKALATEEINNRLDAIWRMRNDIAHANTSGLVLNYGNETYRYDATISAEEYTQFALLFIELVDDVFAFLNKVDLLVVEKWSSREE